MNFSSSSVHEEIQWNEIQSWSMRWQIRRRKMSALFSQGMNEKFQSQFYLNFHYQKLNIQSATIIIMLLLLMIDVEWKQKEEINGDEWKNSYTGNFQSATCFYAFCSFTCSRHHHAFIHSWQLIVEIKIQVILICVSISIFNYADKEMRLKGSAD